MADKDINIHVRTPGTAEAKQNLDKTKESVEGIGNGVEKAGEKSEQATSKFSSMIAGFSKIAIAAAAIKKIGDFFDAIKGKADEAIQKAQDVRQAYDNLFEAAGAYDEKGRQAVVKETESLLFKSGATPQVGYPTIEAYRRNFKDSMKPGDYEAGLNNILSYAARHGGEATPELIQMMRGWGMNTSGQQADMSRLIMGASGQSGLTDNEMIDLLGRASPTARQMNWTPQQTVSILSTLAAGEIGRNKTMRPAQILEEYAKDPEKALKEYPALSRIKPVLPVSAAEDATEQKSYMRTLEARNAQAKALSRQILTQTREGAELDTAIREIGAAEQQAQGGSALQGFLDWAGLFPESRKEWAAYQKWENNLTEDQRAKIRRVMTEFKEANPNTGTLYPFQPAEQDWWFRRATPEQRFESLTGNPVPPQPVQPQSIQQNYYNNMYIEQTPPDAQPRSNGGL